MCKGMDDSVRSNGAVEFLQAVADMEDVRLKARLLALELAAMNVRYNVLDTIPWDRLN